MIYFLLTENAKFVKIGYAKDPQGRVKAVQTSCPYKLFLLGMIEGTEQEERHLHCKFNSYRSYGEWFHYESEIADYLKDALGNAAVVIPLKEYQKLLARLAYLEEQTANCYYVARDGTACNHKKFLSIAKVGQLEEREQRLMSYGLERDKKDLELAEAKQRIKELEQVLADMKNQSWWKQLFRKK